jgi:hypothetical protein
MVLSILKWESVEKIFFLIILFVYIYWQTSVNSTMPMHSCPKVQSLTTMFNFQTNQISRAQVKAMLHNDNKKYSYVIFVVFVLFCFSFLIDFLKIPLSKVKKVVFILFIC